VPDRRGHVFKHSPAADGEPDPCKFLLNRLGIEIYCAKPDSTPITRMVPPPRAASINC
jgi:hypothetical protein